MTILNSDTLSEFPQSRVFRVATRLPFGLRYYKKSVHAPWRVIFPDSEKLLYY